MTGDGSDKEIAADELALRNAFTADGSRGFWQDIQRKDQGEDNISFYYAPRCSRGSENRRWH